MINYKEKLHDIKAFVFDFDGVMTDGSVWTYNNGDMIRCADVKDGYAIQYARASWPKTASQNRKLCVWETTSPTTR